jgi:hypothetical protein
MIRKANISIPTPCHENWQKMDNVEKGRFCASCQKTVYDFTKSSDREILEKINFNKNICGRFLKKQLNRELSVPKEKNSLWIAAASSLLAFLDIGTYDALAQEKPAMFQTDATLIDDLSRKSDSIAGNLITVSGIITDGVVPLAGAYVTIKDTNIGTTSDFDGKYSIMAKAGQVIAYSFIGMSEKEFVVSKNNFDVSLKKNICLDDMAVGQMVRNRTFSGRLFRDIGNWFRSEQNKHY